MIFSAYFWRGAGERALKTFLQTFIPVLLAALGVSTAGVLDAWTAPWLAALESASGLGFGSAFLSFCTSIGNADFTAGKPAAAEPSPKRAAEPESSSIPESDSGESSAAEPGDAEIEEADEDDSEDSLG